MLARILLCLVLVLSFCGTASAHPEPWITAKSTIRKDGSFTVEVGVNREFVPVGFGAKAPDVAIAGQPDADPEVRQEARGALAALSVVFDGVPAPVQAEWRPAKGEGFFNLRLTGRLPAEAKTILFTVSARNGLWAVAVVHEGVDEPQYAKVLGSKQEMAPVALLEGYAPKTASAVAKESVQSGFRKAVPEGIDHVLFVVALVLLATRTRPLLAQFAAFAVAHGAALWLAATGVVSLPSAVAEPLIAVSLAWAGFDNVFTDTVGRRRLLLVVAFGLAHGFGFAGDFARMDVPADQRTLALGAFHGGLELGLLAVLVAAWLVLALPFRNRPWYRTRVVTPASLAIALVGLYWAVTRLLA